MKEEQSQVGSALIPAGNRGVVLTSLEDIWRFAKFVSSSGMAPKGIDKPESVLVAIQMGLELGLSPMAALQNIAVINGRPGIYGDAALALVRASGLCAGYRQRIQGEGDQRKAVVTSWRIKHQNSVELETEFSVADAKRAGLWDKPGPWKQYPDRMLIFKARGFNLRDNFGDVLKGFKTTEELEDYTEIEEKRLPVRPAEFKKKGEMDKPADTVVLEGSPAKTESVPKHEPLVATDNGGSEDTKRSDDPVLQLAAKLVKDKVTTSEVIAVLIEHHQPVAEANETLELSDLPPETVDQAIKQWPTIIFCIEKNRNKAK